MTHVLGVATVGFLVVACSSSRGSVVRLGHGTNPIDSRSGGHERAHEGHEQPPGPAHAHSDEPHEPHEPHEPPPPPLGWNVESGWCHPWPHAHASPCGTPYVHAFGVEPAFLGRDLLVSVRVSRARDDVAVEVESELEWAFTRRLGGAVEIPTHLVVPDGDDAAAGVGDVSLAPRALLVETPRFLLSGNLGVTLPTGDEARGFGSGETSLAPGLSAWLDLGRGLTTSLHAGTSHGLRSGSDEISYGVSLAWSFQGPALCGCPTHGGHAHPSLRAGLVSLMAEVAGGRPWESADESSAEGLLGISWRSTDHTEVRAGFSIPLFGDDAEDGAIVLGFIRHL